MPRKSRRDWLRAGLRRLAREGVDGVRVEPLAKELGVTKGSFYWHFGDRAELLDAMLEEWARSETEAVIERAEAAGSDPQARLAHLTSVATQGFDVELELALRAWGRRDSRVARVLEDAGRRRLGYVKQLLREAGFDELETEARAFLVYSALLGDSLIAPNHGRFGRKRVLDAAMALLAAPTTRDRRRQPARSSGSMSRRR